MRGQLQFAQGGSHHHEIGTGKGAEVVRSKDIGEEVVSS